MQELLGGLGDEWIRATEGPDHTDQVGPWVEFLPVLLDRRKPS